jgi:hypothetical protein
VTLRRGGSAAPLTYRQNEPAAAEMSTAPSPGEPLPTDVDERRQRAWELERALRAARTLQERLELLLDHPADVRDIHELRDRLARELGRER